MTDEAIPSPIPMLLFCPGCSAQHIDEPNAETHWANPPHRSHLCVVCGVIWRQCDYPTTGVAVLVTKGKGDTWKFPRPTYSPSVLAAPYTQARKSASPESASPGTYKPTGAGRGGSIVLPARFYGLDDPDDLSTDKALQDAIAVSLVCAADNGYDVIGDNTLENAGTDMLDADSTYQDFTGAEEPRFRACFEVVYKEVLATRQLTGEAPAE